MIRNADGIFIPINTTILNQELHLPIRYWMNGNPILLVINDTVYQAKLERKQDGFYSYEKGCKETKIWYELYTNDVDDYQVVNFGLRSETLSKMEVYSKFNNFFRSEEGGRIFDYGQIAGGEQSVRTKSGLRKYQPDQMSDTDLIAIYLIDRMKESLPNGEFDSDEIDKALRRYKIALPVKIIQNYLTHEYDFEVKQSKERCSFEAVLATLDLRGAE